jgi:DNA-binding response OmpR family regulator
MLRTEWEVMVAAPNPLRPEGGPVVLVVCPHDDDRARLRGILEELAFVLHEAQTWDEGRSILSNSPVPVVICECTLPDATWKDVLSEIAGLANPPRLIVISALADEYLWSEVLNLGGYDVLPKPLDEKEVARVTGLAWSNWSREFGLLGKTQVNTS